MSTKPFKDIEQVIKNASEGYEPPFEEASWAKMEVLLDKEKDRRKPLFWLWWLLPLLIGGSVGGYFIFNNEPDKNSLPKEIAVVENNKPLSQAQKNDKSDVPVTENLSGAPGTWEPLKSSVKTSDNSAFQQPVTPVGRNKSFSKNSKEDVPADVNGNGLKNKSRVSDETGNRTRIRTESSVATADPEPQNENENKTINKTGTDRKPPNDNTADQVQTKKSEPVIATGKDDKTVNPVNSSAANQKLNKTNSSRFYFIAAAGAEGSGVKLFSSHNITARGGLMIGYQLSNNFSIQTGFFSGSKKYVAGPGDYNAKDGYWSMVDITSVDANCLVYEVPFDVRYDFTPGKSLKIFAASGLSSYIMKEEAYHYSYNYNGYPHHGQATYTGNQHLFSVLKLTAGIEKNISKKFAIHAAPAFSIPLAGVGEGQVKLYSTEIMIGLRYQPLKKIKNK